MEAKETRSKIDPYLYYLLISLRKKHRRTHFQLESTTSTSRMILLDYRILRTEGDLK